MKLSNKLDHWFQRTKFSFWIVYALSRVLSFFYILKTKHVAKVNPHFLLRDVERTLDRLAWNEDEFIILGFKFKHFWMRSAKEVQWYLNNGIIPQTDCDEFATYAAEALRSVDEASDPQILTVRWVTSNGDVKGHNLAIYSYPIQNGMRMYAHIGNWGHFRGFNSVAKIVENIGTIMGCTTIAYAIVTPELKLVAHEKL